MADGQNKGILNGVFLGYFVILLHIVLVLGLGAAVVLIKGIYDFRWFILGGGVIILAVSGFLFFRYLRANNRTLREAMNNPAFQGRTLEISLFGGMASLKVGNNNQHPQLIDVSETHEVRQLVAPPTQTQELSQLAKMLEDKLISREEFERLKKDIVH